VTSKEADEAWHKISAEVHYGHHQFVEMLIEERAAKKEMWRKIRAQTLGWGVISALASLGAWVASKVLG